MLRRKVSQRRYMQPNHRSLLVCQTFFRRSLRKLRWEAWTFFPAWISVMPFPDTLFANCMRQSDTERNCSSSRLYSNVMASVARWAEIVSSSGFPRLLQMNVGLTVTARMESALTPGAQPSRSCCATAKQGGMGPTAICVSALHFSLYKLIVSTLWHFQFWKAIRLHALFF